MGCLPVLDKHEIRLKGLLQLWENMVDIKKSKVIRNHNGCGKPVMDKFYLYLRQVDNKDAFFAWCAFN